MLIPSFFVRLYARYVCFLNRQWMNNPLKAQEKVFNSLIVSAKKTAFGKDFNFNLIKNYSDFKNHVPVVNYEGLKSYIERARLGEQNVLWPGKPIYFCKTSGTTSGIKYIPISKESMPTHLLGAKEAILNYICETGNTEAVKGGTIFIQGSPKLDQSEAIPTGRLSGITAHHVPWYLKRNNLPSYKTNCIDDWEKKIDAIIEETRDQNMTLISGIPPWVQMYFEKLQKKTNKTISQVFSNFSLFIYGGVSFQPYKEVFFRLIGKHVDLIETYPSSEAFIAYQDSQKKEGLLLCVNHGVFFEFIPLSKYLKGSRDRVSLCDVSLGVDYVLILNTNAGLWGYEIGDTISFVSNNPYRIVVSGRVKHFTSAFGEHVIGGEVESALESVLKTFSFEVVEFHVAPQVNPKNGLPYHEWFIEFKSKPDCMSSFSLALDSEMRRQNTYYNDLIAGKVLRPLVVKEVSRNGFIKYMDSMGRLGGQNKIPRLSNDRGIADKLAEYE